LQNDGGKKLNKKLWDSLRSLMAVKDLLLPLKTTTSPSVTILVAGLGGSGVVLPSFILPMTSIDSQNLCKKNIFISAQKLLNYLLFICYFITKILILLNAVQLILSKFDLCQCCYLVLL
jgi:hypothetical protein